MVGGGGGGAAGSAALVRLTVRARVRHPSARYTCASPRQRVDVLAIKFYGPRRRRRRRTHRRRDAVTAGRYYCRIVRGGTRVNPRYTCGCVCVFVCICALHVYPLWFSSDNDRAPAEKPRYVCAPLVKSTQRSTKTTTPHRRPRTEKKTDMEIAWLTQTIAHRQNTPCN